MSDASELPTNEQQPTAAGTASAQQAGDNKPTARTFTEAEMSVIVRDRLQKQEQSILTKYGDPKELSKAAQRLKELEDSQKSEAQKLSELLATREQALTETQTRYKATLIENAALKEIGGQVAPDRIKAAIKLLDTSKLTIGDDGTVAGVTEAVKAMLEENPFLKPTQSAPPTKPSTPKLGATNPAGTSENVDLSWFKGANPSGNTVRGGGVRSPSEG